MRQWCSKSLDMDMETFKEQWPDVPMQDWNPGITNRARQGEGAYSRGDAATIRVTDYWWKEPMRRTAVELVRQQETRVDRLVMYEDEHGDVFDELQGRGLP